MTTEKKPELTTQKMRDIYKYSVEAMSELGNRYDDKAFESLFRTLLDQTSVRGDIYQRFADFEIEQRKAREVAKKK